MGPASTLTLINGRRVAASSFASGTENFVDINAIPLAAIERIEVLATGASAIYGADAVAGVINYILKDDFEGLEVSGSYKNTTESEDESATNLQLYYGTKLGGGHLSIFADYYDRKPVKATTREVTANPVLVNSYSYLPKNTPNIYYRSTVSGDEIGNPNCATEFVTTVFGEEICAYYRNEDDYLETPLESVSAGFMYTKTINDMEWRTDFIVSRTDSTSFSSPAPIDDVFGGEGPFVHESVIDSFSPEFAQIIADDVYIDPYFTQLDQRLFGFRFDARFSDPRTVEVETNAMRLVSELNGQWDDWNWRAGVLLSQSESEQVATAGVYNRYRYHAALSGELCADGSVASYDIDNDVLSCNGSTLLGFYNPFLQGDAANDELLSLAQSMPTRDGKSTLYGADFTISGELVEFNGRFISAAFGAEVRREEITDVPSLDARARFSNEYLVDVLGFGSSLSEADRTQYGAYAEFQIPLSDELEVNLAGRFDDYSDFGSTFNPKVSVSYRPTDDLIIRGSYATAFRAPSLTQSGVKLRTTRASFDCGASQAVADLYCEGAGSLRGNDVLELGNPNLKAEESTSVSVGFAYSPSRDTTITVDYWQFEHDDLVDTNMTGVMVAAIEDGSLRHCGLVPEGQAGISYDPDICALDDDGNYIFADSNDLGIDQEGANLSEILDEWIAIEDPRFFELPLFRDHVLLLDNTGTQELSGIDYAAFHAIDLGNDTELELDVNGTYYASFERNIPGQDEIEELAGTFTYPEHIASIGVFYTTRDWYVGASLYYTSSFADDIDGLSSREFDEVVDLGVLDENDARDVDAWTTLDVSAGYYFDNADVRLTIENITDEEAPLAYGSTRGFDSLNHNQFGTIYRVSFDYRF
jgi:outer membrane receptor protein involved in Fe transport